MILESIREELEYNREKALYESIDVKELLEDYNELLSNTTDMIVNMLNEEMIFTESDFFNESIFDDLNIKKRRSIKSYKIRSNYKTI